MAGALIAATSALSSQAADQSDFFAQQRQITDGYYPRYTVQPTPARQKPETAHQVAEGRWLEQERAAASTSVAPVPFPPPAPVAASTRSSRETAHQAAEDKWLTQERNETDGNVAPVPFLPGSTRGR
jgi:hypothetical protein